jgi:hypothetical protein
MPRRLPLLAVMLGVAGVIPFMLCGLGSVSASFVGAQPSVLLLLAYGAGVLSFLGGIHWGMALATDDGGRQRLSLGIMPGFLGWLTLAVALYTGRPTIGIALQIALFILAAAGEWRGQLLGGIPARYIVLRIAVTVAIVAILTTVLVLRVAGGHLLL